MAVDYFAGQNEGNRNLMNALDSYTREERERPIRELQTKLLNQKVQEGDITLSAAQERVKKLADIYSVREKIPASMTFPSDTTQAPPQILPNSDMPLYQTDTSLIPKINPATNYTPQEQDQQAMDYFKKTGDLDSLTKMQGAKSHQSEEARKTVEMLASINIKTGGNIERTKELAKAYNKLSGGQFTDEQIDSISSITQGANGVIIATDVKDSQGNLIGHTYVDQTGKGVHAPIVDPNSKTDKGHLTATSLQRDVDGNPTATATQAQSILDKMEASDVRVAGSKASSVEKAKSEGGFASWTPEAQKQSFMVNMITKEPPASVKGMGGNDRKAYAKAYSQWQVDAEFSPQDIALMQSDYKAGSMSLNNMSKQEAPMSAFVLNINKQIAKVEQLYNNNDRTGIRLIDKPVRDLKILAQGSGDEAIKASYLLEISNEIGKLSSGASASVQQLSDSAKEDWKKVHDPNLSFKEIMKVVNATRDQANMRMETWRQAKEEVRGNIQGLGTQTRSVGKYDDAINAAAQKNNLDPELVKKVINQESQGNTRAISPKDARGLMQLSPGIRKDYGVTDPHDPQQNIEVGTKVLGKLMTKYNGDKALALAAYNWGPDKVDNDPNLTNAPKETRDYLKKIIGVAESRKSKSGKMLVKLNNGRVLYD